MSWVEERGGKISLKVWLQPRASKDAIGGLHDDALKIFITCPPVDGRANERLIGVLSKKLRIPASSIIIRSGKSSRRKTLQISGLSAQEAIRKLEA